MQPRILISPDETFDATAHRPFYLIKRSYGLAIGAAGGLPFLASDPLLAEDYAALCDGLVLTDGVSPINPGRYGEEIQGVAGYETKSWYDYHFNYLRDSMDISLCRAFLAADRPILGIGRGMLILNIVLGGSLTAADVEENVDGPLESLCITPVEGRFLSKMKKSGTFRVTGGKRPQTIGRTGDGLVAVARDDRGRVAALAHETRPVFGISWNPELSGTDDAAYIDALHRRTDAGSGPYKMADTPDVRGPFMELHKTMRPFPGMPTDKDAGPEAADAVFTDFIKLCEKRDKSRIG